MAVNAGRVLVVLDIDGTLLHSVAAHVAAFWDALAEVGVVADDAGSSGFLHHTDSWIFRELFHWQHARAPDTAEFAVFAAALSRAFTAASHDLPQVAGAAAFLRRLDASPDHTVVFATGGLREVTTVKLAGLAPDAPADLVVTASDHTFREHIVREAIRRGSTAGTFGRVISIGDGPWDVRAAVATGSEFIGVGATSAAFGDWFPATHLISSFDEVDLTRDYTLSPPPGAVPAAPEDAEGLGSTAVECHCWT